MYKTMIFHFPSSTANGGLQCLSKFSLLLWCTNKIITQMTIKIVLLGKLPEKSQRNNTDDADTASILSFNIRLYAAIRHVETFRF